MTNALVNYESCPIRVYPWKRRTFCHDIVHQKLGCILFMGTRLLVPENKGKVGVHVILGCDLYIGEQSKSEDQVQKLGR